MRNIKFIVILLLSMLVLAACAKSDPNQGEDLNQPVDKIDINIGAMKGPTGMGMAQIMDNGAKGETANNYNFTVVGAADEISAGLIKGEFDIAAVPCNLASVLYNKTEGEIHVLGINTLGVLYIVETGQEIQKVSDLKGKTIYSTGYGTTPQYTLNYLLESNGIDIDKDVTIEYKAEATEVAAMLSESDNGIAMLPQPFVTSAMMNNDQIRIALDVAQEWDALDGEGASLVTGVVVVRKEFLEENKEAVDAFMKEYQESASFVNEYIDEAAQLIEDFDIFKAPVAKKAIPFSNIVFISGKEMKEKINSYLNVLFTQNPESVGGAMPDDNFYYLP